MDLGWIIGGILSGVGLLAQVMRGEKVVLRSQSPNLKIILKLYYPQELYELNYYTLKI